MVKSAGVSRPHKQLLEGVQLVQQWSPQEQPDLAVWRPALLWHLQYSVSVTTVVPHWCLSSPGETAGCSIGGGIPDSGSSYNVVN